MAVSERAAKKPTVVESPPAEPRRRVPLWQQQQIRNEMIHDAEKKEAAAAAVRMGTGEGQIRYHPETGKPLDDLPDDLVPMWQRDQ